MPPMNLADLPEEILVLIIQELQLSVADHRLNEFGRLNARPRTAPMTRQQIRESTRKRKAYSRKVAISLMNLARVNRLFRRLLDGDAAFWTRSTWTLIGDLHLYHVAGDLTYLPGNQLMFSIDSTRNPPQLSQVRSIQVTISEIDSLFIWTGMQHPNFCWDFWRTWPEASLWSRLTSISVVCTGASSLVLNRGTATEVALETRGNRTIDRFGLLKLKKETESKTQTRWEQLFKEICPAVEKFHVRRTQPLPRGDECEDVYGSQRAGGESFPYTTAAKARIFICEGDDEQVVELGHFQDWLEESDQIAEEKIRGILREVRAEETSQANPVGLL